MSMTYVVGVTVKINGIIKNHGLSEDNIVMKPVNKILNYVNSIKDNIKKGDKNDVVYRINCSNFESVYIGQSGMTVNKRMYFNRSNLNVGNKTNTSLWNHLLRSNHKAKWEDVAVRHIETNLFKRSILEGI